MPKRSRSLDEVEPTPTSRARTEANRPRCCWPNCPKVLNGEHLPLCMAHQITVHNAVESYTTGEAFTLRYRATVPSPEPDEPAPGDARDGVVYYLRVGSYIKIGWTADLTKRMRAYSPDSVLLATEPGTRRDENRRHRMFAAHRTHGREWYAMTPSVMHHVQQMAAQHGTPDPVTFAAKPVAIPQPRRVQPVKTRSYVL